MRHGCIGKEHASAISKSVSEYLKHNPRVMSTTTCDKISKSMLGKQKSEQHIINLIEVRYGGFWYGNVKNDMPKYTNKYCELWTEDLKERIRAYWGYVSALSGDEETSINKKYNTVRSISCHHVYYQPKACCVWDKDEKGYYAPINIGTTKIPIVYNHYIDGDPNKFVTLTAKEHKKTDYNKLEWIKIFETIIEDQGGKCYFTKDDVERE